MERLPFPGGCTADSDVGHFHVTVQLGSRGRERFVPIDPLVDTGAMQSVIPPAVAERLGLIRLRRT